MPKVYNKHQRNAPLDAVFVGRPSKWGNPFAIDHTKTREQVIAQFEELVLKSPITIASIKTELKDKDLVCFCAPRPCHADILLRIANEEETDV